MRRNVAVAALPALVSGVLCAVGRPAPAAADEPSAQALYTSGMADLAAKRYATACPALRKSFRADARAETLFELAECEAAAGHITSSAAAFDDYLALYERLSPSEQKDEKDRERAAVQRREAIERDIPKVTFALPANVPDGVRVTRRLPEGGESVDVAVGVPLPIDPGEHFVATQGPDRPTLEKRFVIHKGEQLTVRLDIAPADPAKASRFSRPIAPVPNMLPPLDPGISGQRAAAYVTGGVGVAGVLLSAVTGAIVWAQKGTIYNALYCNNDMPHLCNPRGMDAADLAKSLGVVSTAAIVVGGALLATGVVLYVTEPAPTKLGKGPARGALGLNAGPIPGGAALGTTLTW